MKNWYDATDSSCPIITPKAEIEGYLRKRADIQQFGVHARFLMLQTRQDIARLQKYARVTEEDFLLPAFLSKRPLYALDGAYAVSLLEEVFSAPAAADALEVAIAMGARELFFFGLCGAISERVNVGDLIVPTAVEREEGTSYHYLPSEDAATPDLDRAAELFRYLGQHTSLRVHQGTTVSTDAVFRQTLRKERAWRKQGVLAVDMEMSALLAVARYHRLASVCLLVVSDKHELEEGSEWRWGGHDLAASREQALKLFTEFIGTIAT